MNAIFLIHDATPIFIPQQYESIEHGIISDSKWTDLPQHPMTEYNFYTVTKRFTITDYHPSVQSYNMQATTVIKYRNLFGSVDHNLAQISNYVYLGRSIFSNGNK